MQHPMKLEAPIETVNQVLVVELKTELCKLANTQVKFILKNRNTKISA